MADRLLRDEIWESERYLDLHTDTQRLAFIRLLTEADDFGNLQGGTRRVYRMLTRVMHVKTEEEAAAILSALQDVDLIRFYTVADVTVESGRRELIHIPRFKAHRDYVVRKVPASPWCTPDTALGKHKRLRKQGLASDAPATSHARAFGLSYPQAPRPSPEPPQSYPQAPEPDENDLSTDPKARISVIESNQGPAENVAATSQTRAMHVQPGVGVGVGEGEEQHRSPTYPQARPETAPTRPGSVAALLRLKGIQVTSMMPEVIEWATAGVPDEVLLDVVERCRLHKPEPEKIGVKYFAAVLRAAQAERENPKAPPAPPWWQTEQATLAKGTELGLSARPGETMATFRQRIFELAAKKTVKP